MPAAGALMIVFHAHESYCARLKLYWIAVQCQRRQGGTLLQHSPWNRRDLVAVRRQKLQPAQRSQLGCQLLDAVKNM